MPYKFLIGFLFIVLLSGCGSGLCPLRTSAGVCISSANGGASFPFGIIDGSFGSGGIVTTAIDTFQDEAYGAAIQTDGKLVIVGSTFSMGNFTYDYALARYNTDGSLDTTFNTTGKVTTQIIAANHDYARSVAIQTDGKIVAAGNSLNGAAYNFTLARYNTNGSLDTTFNTTGYQNTLIGAGSSAASVAVQVDGKIVLAGSSGAAGINDFAVARYNTNGSLDTTFNTTGTVTTAIGAANDYVNTMALQSDGKIVVGGFYDNGTYNDFAVVRYNTNGSLDTTFNTTGKVTTSFGYTASLRSLAIQTDGKIVVAGYYTNGTNYFALARYNPNGTLDGTFGTAGKTSLLLGTSAMAVSVAIQSNGKILVLGSVDFGVSSYTTARFNSNGQLDNTFGTNGYVTTQVGSANDVPNALVIQSDGKFIAVGGAYVPSESFAAVRYK